MNEEFRSPIFCNNEPVTVTFIYIYNRYNNTNTGLTNPLIFDWGTRYNHGKVINLG